MSAPLSNVPLAIRANRLRFAHESHEILSDLSFEIKQGQCLYVQGKNGAGKTTLLKLLCGFFKLNEGEILFNNKNIRHQLDDYQRQILFLGHKLSIYPELTILENIKYYLSLVNEPFDESKVLDVLAQLNLKYFIDVSCKQLSAGQQRKVALSRLWLVKRAIWILDEPFYALDQSSVDLINKKISDQIKDGMVIVSAHHGLSIDSNHVIGLEL